MVQETLGGFVNVDEDFLEKKGKLWVLHHEERRVRVAIVFKIIIFVKGESKIYGGC